MKHPARTMTYAELWEGLQQAMAWKLVSENVSADGLRLYCYTTSCVYEKRWNDITTLARGIILDPRGKRIVATPFPKFFNIGERIESIPDLPFEKFEKLDGSLIIIFHHRGEWRTATKGSFGSNQAKWASAVLARNRNLDLLDKESTYLAEAVYPENRIVVRYNFSGLVLLAAYRGDGIEMDYDELMGIGERLRWRVAKRHSFASISELLALTKSLPSTEEGYVIRFADGLRLKVKGDEYCRIHRMISRLTPLAIWETMLAGDDLESVRRRLPEEFLVDFDNIVAAIDRRVAGLVSAVKSVADPIAELSDKEVGMRLDTLPDRLRRFVFPYRKNGGDLLSPRSREMLFREIRPDGNDLDGYTPSTAINRISLESEA